MNTTTSPVSIIERLLHLDNHMKFAKLQPTYKNRNRDFTISQRFEAGNLLYISSLAHQSHAWRDSEDDEERDAWAKHTKNIDMVRTQLKFGAPCPELLNVISADLDFLTCTVVMCIDDSEKLKNLNSHCSYLSVFLSEAEGKSNCLIA